VQRDGRLHLPTRLVRKARLAAERALCLVVDFQRSAAALKSPSGLELPYSSVSLGYIESNFCAACLYTG